jgi:hypothetical protein
MKNIGLALALEKVEVVISLDWLSSRSCLFHMAQSLFQKFYLIGEEVDFGRSFYVRKELEHEEIGSVKRRFHAF